MSLKQSIVVVNEFSVRGSRGSTPGKYVERYMGRDGAVENLAPLRYDDTDSYILRYMARSSAADTALQVSDFKETLKKNEGLGGIAFGFGEFSLSHKKLKKASKEIQKAHDEGKTILKTVLSFDTDYLKEHNIIDKDFEFKEKGDFKGNIDQMKLRLGIMKGLNRMSRHFDDLQYVGVIQVDTAHVHCHLSMVDMGDGNILQNGEQRGKLLPYHKKELRRGIDMYLDENQKVSHMASSITYDKRNALCHLKKFTHRLMKDRSFPQFLLSTLPENKNWWRASTNRKEMKKANAMTREYVEEIYAQPNSGYREALDKINTYAKERASHEGLSTEEYQKLVRTGQKQLIDDGINAVYSVLMNVKDESRTIETPMMSAMAMSMEEMVSSSQGDPMVEFGFKLRSYSSRLKHHKREKDRWNTFKKSYEESENNSEDSEALYHFFEEEYQYHHLLHQKYLHFLKFLPPKESYQEDFDNILDYDKRISNLEAMIEDKTFSRFKSSESAEQYGLDVYDSHGGRFVKNQKSILEERVSRMKSHQEDQIREFNDKLLEEGLHFDGHGVRRGLEYDFDSVKALDLHHLGYDFLYDVDVSEYNVQNFVEVTNQRYNAYLGAKDYLELTGQEEFLRILPTKDVEVMKELADRLDNSPLLESKRAPGGKRRLHSTISLDFDYTTDVKLAVQSAIQGAIVEDRENM